MTDEPPPTTSEVLVRQLSRRYLMVFAAVAGLIAVDQALIQPMLVRIDGYAPAINLAGRQRMLSQQMVKAALVMQATSDERARSIRRDELRRSLREWTAAHAALREGGFATKALQVRSSATDQHWARLTPYYQAMHNGAALLLNDTRAEDPSARATATALLIDNESAFLATMDGIVSLLENEAARQLARLRLWALGVAAAIIALLAALGRFVVHPAVAAIRGTIDDLERRVALRTQELEATLASLRHEIAERERSESHSKNLAAQLAHADRVESMGRLAAGLAHELNQPLGAIANYSQASSVMLSRSLDDDSRVRLEEFNRNIQQASLRAGGIIRRIRNFVRPNQGNAAIVELSQIVREVIELCAPEARRVEAELSQEPCERVIWVRVDPIQIQQVLVNLLQNALQAVDHLPPQRRRVMVRMAAGHGAVQVDVVDDGPGLAEADPEALFAPFRSTKPDGMGIGLSICRSILEQHQGAIWAKSLPGTGAQFSFVLPLAEQHGVQCAS